MTTSPEIESIVYLSDWSDVNPTSDNIDVHVVLKTKQRYTFVVATPTNILWCMENEGKDYFFGAPLLFVKTLTLDNVERAIRAIVNEDNGRWLPIYGA